MELFFRIAECYDLIGWIIYGILNIFEYKIVKTLYFKSFAFLLMLDTFLTIQNYIFNINSTNVIFIENIFICFFTFCRIISNIQSDKINKKNVCIVFYQNLKNIQQYTISMFGLNVASAGLILGDDLFQLRKEFNTIQKLTYTEDYIYSKYIVIDTGFPISELKGDWECELLKQKARQPRTLWFRLNCLNTLEFVINQIPDYKFKYETLPSIYLLKLKIKGII
jgi:hypothetical protein